MLVACGSGQSQDDSDQTPAVTPFAWQIPDIYPRPVIPAENPMTEEKFQLGRHLFYDKRLSGNGTQSCSSCHEQSKAFSDGKITPQGSTGQVLARNSQALTNVAYNATQTWANPSITTLERQILIPLFGEFPVEHGINDENRDEILQTLIEDPVYVRLFQKAYPELGSAISYNEVVNSLATFVRGLTSFDSPFDRFQQGDLSALSSNAIQGARLFFSERLECVHCHGGYNFSDSTIDETTQFPESPFHNTGLYNTDGSGAYPTG
ncbi:MAG: di-heme enzyme, partial [Gammaproteobacteria bacterium]|nr:di-heme enzyme [Gammaproteobacteria bacterium]